MIVQFAKQYDIGCVLQRLKPLQIGLVISKQRVPHWPINTRNTNLSALLLKNNVTQCKQKPAS